MPACGEAKLTKGSTCRTMEIPGGTDYSCEYGLLLLVFLALLTPALKAQDAATSTILGAMKAELARSQQAFKTERVQPYFLSYEITDDQVVNVSGEFGKLQTSQQSRSRQLDIDLRVGNPAFGQHPRLARRGWGAHGHLCSH